MLQTTRALWVMIRWQDAENYVAVTLILGQVLVDVVRPGGRGPGASCTPRPRPGRPAAGPTSHRALEHGQGVLVDVVQMRASVGPFDVRLGYTPARRIGDARSSRAPAVHEFESRRTYAAAIQSRRRSPHGVVHSTSTSCAVQATARASTSLGSPECHGIDATTANG